MTKVTLASVGTIIDATTAAATINSNNAAIVAAIENTLSRDGNQPDQMNATLDMNSHDIINLPSPSTQNSPLRVQDATLLNGSGTLNILPTGGASSQVLTKNSSSNYDVSWQSQITAAVTPQFGGRLTLSSGQPVMQNDVIGSQTLYYAPYIGKTVPTYTSGVWTTRNFTTSSTDQVGLSLSLAGSANWAVGTIHDVFAVMDSGTLKLGTRLWDASMLPGATTTPTVTTVITTGTTPNAWARPTAAFNGTNVQNGATGAQVVNLGINNFLGSDWGVGVSKIVTQVQVWAASDNTFLGGGTLTTDRVNVEGSNDGVNFTLLGYGDVPNTSNGANAIVKVGSKEAFRYHRVGFLGNNINNNSIAQIQFTVETPATTRRLTTNDGVVVNDASMTIRTSSTTTITTAQYEGIYLGTIQIDGTAGQITAHSSYGPSRVYNVWNFYNRIPIKLRAGAYFENTSGATNGFTVVNTSWAPTRSDATNCLTVLVGYPDQKIKLDYIKAAYLAAGAVPQDFSSGIGIDSTSVYSGTYWSTANDLIGPAIGQQGQSKVILPSFSGTRKATMIEYVAAGSNSTTSFVNEQNAVLTAEWNG